MTQNGLLLHLLLDLSNHNNIACAIKLEFFRLFDINISLNDSLAGK